MWERIKKWFRKEEPERIILPDFLEWDSMRQRLTCMRCYPAHTEPQIGFYFQPTREFLWDDNIEYFLRWHLHEAKMEMV